jgi:carbamoyl-phosphate synthase small subunit
MTNMKKIKLVLQDGTEFVGESFGAECSSNGELVFSTGMVGYPESYTDPSFSGQIIVNTFPLIGNYGVPEEQLDADGLSNFESNQIHVKGVITSEYSENFNHWEAQKSLGQWLKENNVPGITGIDTRLLTQRLRENGSSLAKIIFEEEIDFQDPNQENLIAKVSPKEVTHYPKGEKTVVVIDCGCKDNIIKSFLNRNISVIRVPWNYDIFANDLKFDGIFISNGPGDPNFAQETLSVIRKAFDKDLPIFGICLGIQLIALAAGAKTYKLKYGHRGQNQPCLDIIDGNKCYITSQNHGFAVDPETLPEDWQVWMINTNDNTVEGIKHKSKPFFAVQFHPEHKPGPTDTEFLFDEFINKL